MVQSLELPYNVKLKTQIVTAYPEIEGTFLINIHHI